MAGAVHRIIPLRLMHSPLFRRQYQLHDDQHHDGIARYECHYRFGPCLPEVGANGQYYTAGLPILLNPNANSFVTYSNAFAGFYNANNQFISRNWTGAGSPGSFSGVSFVVLSNGTSITYPFTQYPLSGSSGGANVFNLYSGILAVAWDKRNSPLQPLPGW